jgi:hypothetical protein
VSSLNNLGVRERTGSSIVAGGDFSEARLKFQDLIASLACLRCYFESGAVCEFLGCLEENIGCLASGFRDEPGSNLSLGWA